MLYDAKNYPKNAAKYKEVYGFGGIRIYQVSEEEGKEIAKEFPKSFTFKTPFAVPVKKNEQLFYMNVNHGEQHFLFLLPLQ